MPRPRFAEVLAEYEARADYERSVIGGLPGRELLERRDEFLVPVGPQTGAFLNTLAKTTGVRSILEIGTSYGYSTLWLAEAARANGGMVTTLELHAHKVEYARERLLRADLADFVTCHVGDARRQLAVLDGPWDLILLDAWKDAYVDLFDLAFPKVTVGGLVIADNMLQPAAAKPFAAAYRRHVQQLASATTMLLPIGSGLELTQKRQVP